MVDPLRLEDYADQDERRAVHALMNVLIDRFHWKPGSDRPDVQYRDAFVSLRAAMESLKAAATSAEGT